MVRAKRLVVLQAESVRQSFEHKLVTDLMYGRVPLPAAWLQADDRSVLALDPDTPLSEAEDQACQRLTEDASEFVRIITAMARTASEKYQDGVRTGQYQRKDVDAARRGRGPVAIRNLLFEKCSAWPRYVPHELKDDAQRVVDEAMEVRKRTRAGLTPADADWLNKCATEVHHLVTAWASNQHRPGLAGDLLSEVYQTLQGSLLKNGGPPSDLPSWIDTTCQFKLKEILGGVLKPQPLGPITGDAPAPADSPRIRRAIRRAAKVARETAVAYRSAATGPDDTVQEQRAVLEDVIADLLHLANVDLLADVISGSEAGTGELDRRLERAQIPAARQRTMRRAIRDRLRALLETEVNRQPPDTPADEN